ncbi:MAG TPA: PIN domain-containing protein [Rhizomicrobium sp.]|nr:PIN domain-containing protein [Rhizomicrobium sp.]
MAERITLDSNILVYAFDNTEPEKQPIAMDLLWLAHDRGAVLTTTALGEFYWVMVRKSKVAPLKAHGHLRDLITLFPVLGFGTDTLEAAALAVAGGRFGFWDSVILATAEDAGCRVCFSEDMKDGAQFGNIVVRNPFGTNGLSDAAREVLGL